MIEFIKNIYSLIPEEEFLKRIPKVKEINGVDNTTKIVYLCDINGNSELRLFKRNKLIERLSYKSKIYIGVCEIFVFRKDINGYFSFDKLMLKEILNL
jgi:hypothetical protein